MSPRAFLSTALSPKRRRAAFALAFYVEMVLGRNRSLITYSKQQQHHKNNVLFVRLPDSHNIIPETDTTPDYARNQQPHTKKEETTNPCRGPWCSSRLEDNNDDDSNYDDYYY